ncbi:aldolase/citrate lyase family protein [Marivita sp. GX14005]|uniref:HpcH/HpaI aldolase family protein n=1 Tax=Marivita sp. GX14005 TaxID=2942276 RepID=UPI002019F453|nr:aldolase/citrate lyase family protein [Marivita sp. GX14005]MCL3883516.1 aldolase/citrate lyase family protein [Marivita sp. GX14005]
MQIAGFRQRLVSRVPLAGTFLKTPSYQIVEVLAQSELDFVCLDVEHAPFDRAAVDACCAIGRALDFPVLIRVGDASPREILQALDCGAVGVVVPHVDSAAKAADVARAARFGGGGRGYAGSTRWAGYATQSMPDLLARSQAETVVIAQIEEPEGVDASDAIAATDGIDALFLGPADLSVGYGHDNQSSDQLFAAIERVGSAAAAAGKAYVSWVANAQKARDWARYGMSCFFIASEHSWMRAGATAEARGVHEIGKAENGLP